MNKKHCYILHAYSSKNSGDGLLVNKTIEKVDAIFGNRISKTIVAIDPSSFSYLASCYNNIEVISIFEFVKRSLFRKVTDTYFVAVGGGYLRSGYLEESIKCALTHGIQLILLGIYKNSKSIYLSQSIGPLNGIVGFLLRALLKRNVDLILARDDKTVSELNDKGLLNVVRAPDLVTDSILRTSPLNKVKTDKVYLIARALNSKDYNVNYIEKIKEIYSRLDNVEVVIQSDSRGNNDIDFANKHFGIRDYKNVKEALKFEPGVVISVRLHGSLESISSGCPSIHLAYERKGLAAYSDLNIQEYCHHCSNIDVEKVLEQVEYLKNGSAEFFEKIAIVCSESSIIDGNISRVLL